MGFGTAGRMLAGQLGEQLAETGLPLILTAGSSALVVVLEECGILFDIVSKWGPKKPM